MTLPSAQSPSISSYSFFPQDLEAEPGFQIARQGSDLVIYPIRLKCIYYMLKHIPVSSENELQNYPGLNFRDPLEQVQEKRNLLRGKQNQTLIQSTSALGSTTPPPAHNLSAPQTFVRRLEGVTGVGL